MFFSQRAYKALHSIVDPCGEFLPITYNQESGYLFNTLTLSDSALDMSLCQKNEWGEITWIAFDEDKLQGHPLFRTEYDNYMSVFCNEAFKQACEEAKLEGLIFSQDLSGQP